MKPPYTVFSRMGAFITVYLLRPAVVYGAFVVLIIGIVGLGLCLLSLR